MRPGEHALGRFHVHHITLHEHLEHGAAERPGENGDVMERHMDEIPIGPKPAVGHEEV